MSRDRSRPRRVLAAAAGAGALVALATMQPVATGAPSLAIDRTSSIATLMTRDFRVAVVAQRQNGGSTPTAEVRVGFARRVDGRWRERGETRLGETYFWNTVSGPRSVCRLAIASTGSRPSSRPYATVQLLLSPSLGCGTTYRLPLPGR